MPFIVGGLFLIVASVLGITFLVGVFSPQRTVLVVNKNLDSGVSIGQADVIEQRLPLDESIASLNTSQSEFGQVAAQEQYVTAARIEQGTILTGAHLVPLNAPPESFTLVGLVLEPGAYPRSDLVEGDDVQVLTVSGSGQSQLAAELTPARVVKIEDLGSNLFVTLEVPKQVAPRVADYASSGQVRLALPRSG